VTRWLRTGWQALRRISGDDAYERYLAHRSEAHADEPVLDRRRFYVERQRAKWSGINRCC
jgi:uncharacterized short protein YbdD (DUF466 family)